MKRLLLGIAILLLGLLLWQWRHWRQPLPRLETEAGAGLSELVSAPAVPDPAQAIPMLRPENDYLVVLERPLFLPERRPPPDEPIEDIPDDVTEEVAELARLNVNATLILSPNEASVWLRDPDRPDLVRLRLGDEYKGWTVAGIEPDYVVMERQGTTETLDLWDFSAPNARVGRPPDARSSAPSRPRPTAAGPIPVTR